MSNNRQHKRIEKPLTIKFCLMDHHPRRWDMSIIKNISKGGVRFTAINASELEGKTLQLHIQIPVLKPHVLDIKAVVVGISHRAHTKFYDIRAKFIDLTPANEEHLAVVEKMIDEYEMRQKV